MPVRRVDRVAVLEAVATLVGLGALLYGIGFLALTAHYHALGLWAGEISSQDVSEEGGRFLYHLIFLIPALLGRWRPLLFGMVAVSIGIVTARRWRRLNPWLDPIRRLQARAPRQVLVLITVLVSIVLAQTVWRVLQIETLLHRNDEWLSLFKQSSYRLGFYWQVVVRIVALAALAIVLWRRVWRRTPSRMERLVVGVQWAVALSAVAIWPMAYGKLVISYTRPTVRLASSPDVSLLIRSSGSRYFVWNPRERQMEIVEVAPGDRVVLGTRTDLME
jgi:hypothetical protein